MRSDQIVATAVFLAAIARCLTRDSAPDDTGDRIGALSLAYALVLFWRVVAALPVFGIFESMATDYRNPDLRVPTALIAWGVFLFLSFAVVFR